MEIKIRDSNARFSPGATARSDNSRYRDAKFELRPLSFPKLWSSSHGVNAEVNHGHDESCQNA